MRFLGLDADFCSTGRRARPGAQRRRLKHADDFEIYNIVTDPKETTNLASAKPALQQQMKDRVLQVRRPGGGVTRPYDNELVPVVKAGADASNLLDYTVFEGTWPWLPDFDLLTPAKTGRVSGLDLSVRLRETNFGILFRRCFLTAADGEYTLHLTSDTGAQLRLDDALVIDDVFNHDGSEATASIRLQAGLHPLRLCYRHQRGAAALRLEYSGPGIQRHPVPAAAWRSPVAPPTTGQAVNPLPQNGGVTFALLADAEEDTQFCRIILE